MEATLFPCALCLAATATAASVLSLALGLGGETVVRFTDDVVIIFLIVLVVRGRTRRAVEARQ